VALWEATTASTAAAKLAAARNIAAVASLFSRLTSSQCVAGLCSAGERAGLACSGGVGSAGTTVECPPSLARFVGRLPVALSPLTTAPTQLTSATGDFCPGQPIPGAFGAPASAIHEAGAPLLQELSNVFATTVAGVFCVPSTGNGLIDLVADVPGPGAVSVPGMAAVQLF